MHPTENSPTPPAVRFDLLDILHTIALRRKFILLLTGLAVLIVLAMYFLAKPEYNAKVEVIVGNPMYSDRSRLFSQGGGVDYFANEQINDRTLAIANSSQVAREIIQRKGLMEVYEIKTDKPGAMAVSYTHLDVYKRQPQQRLRWPQQ